jgi:DNA-binding transcriptional regulator YiaG
MTQTQLYPNNTVENISEMELSHRKRGRRSKQLLHDIQEIRRYWNLKEEVLARTMWRTQFGRCY